ncbi:MFS transporter [Candidatus Daviesbacteria bacterium]|nr:MFS transporter [Candidatus Daviesbacteria bacterium]
MENVQSFSPVLKNRGFLNLWLNQILVQFSQNSLNFALLFWVYYLTSSNLAVAALLFCIYLPATLFGVISGVLADLIDRKKIILSIDILLAILFFLFLFLKFYFPAILILVFLVNSLVQFYIPAESSALPLIVRPNQFFRANSLFSITLFAMFLIGFGLSGPIIVYLGIDFVFIIGGVSLVIAFILALKFPSITAKADSYNKRLIKDIQKRNLAKLFDHSTVQIKKTLQMIKGKLAVLYSIIILAGVQTVIGVSATLLPAFLETRLKVSATDASYIVILPLGLGTVLGAFLIGKFGHFFPKRILVGRAILAGGLFLFLIGLVPLLSPAIKYIPTQPAPFFSQPFLSGVMSLGSFLIGAAVVAIIIPSQTVLQQNTPEENRGKVYGALIALMSGLSLIPVLLTGVVADKVGTIPIFIGIGGFIILFGLLILKPDFYFEKKHLPFKVREFLGLGHWEK